MINWGALDLNSAFSLASIYIVGRAAIFYLAFHLAYKKFFTSHGIMREVPTKKQIRGEIILNIKANVFEILMLTAILGLNINSLKIFSPHDFTWARFFGTFAFVYFFFEMWFYASHRLFHTRYFAWAHKPHHGSIITNPMSALSLSLTEKLINDIGMLIIPCIVSYFFPIVIEGILAYHFVNFYNNVQGHSNLELQPVWFTRSKAGKYFSTATYHSIHHLRGHNHYGLFLNIFDRAFNTIDPDYHSNLNKVLDAEGLTRKNIWKKS